jgi:flagellar basal body-associated protein FliL
MTGKRNNSILIVGIIVFIIIFLVSSGSLAYFLWQTSDAQKTEVTFTIDQYFEIHSWNIISLSNINLSVKPLSNSLVIKNRSIVLYTLFFDLNVYLAI